MPTYPVDPTDPSTPTNTQGATQGAEEFRALKAYLATLIGTFPGYNFLRKNAIIGGSFDTNPWQKGTNFVNWNGAVYGPDRWNYARATTTLVVDGTKEASGPTVAQAGKLINNCLTINATTAEAAVGAAESSILQQYIEGYNFAAMLAQRPMVLSFWHKHTKAGTYCVCLRNSAPDRSYVAEYTQDVADTWERAEIAISASPSTGTWDYTNGIGLRLGFVQLMGTDGHTATPNQWVNTNVFATANQVNAFDTIGNKFRIADVQLESGLVATPFESRSFGQELELCRRYAKVLSGTGVVFGSLQVNAATTAILYVEGPMRAAPTFSTLSGTPQISDAAVIINITGYGAGTSTNSGVQCTLTAAAGGMTAGNAGIIYAGGPSSILISAEL